VPKALLVLRTFRGFKRGVLLPEKKMLAWFHPFRVLATSPGMQDYFGLNNRCQA
jgi:hypothetical protein